MICFVVLSVNGFNISNGRRFLSFASKSPIIFGVSVQKHSAF